MAADAVTESFRFPDNTGGRPDSGVIDVTKWSTNPSLNANPAAGNNDFAALQAVINAYAGSSRIIYFPAGTYEIDQQLVVPIITSNRASTRTVLQGENRDSVTIKVNNNVGLQGAAILFQIITADAFRNAVRDLTIDIGVGNPNADGLQFTGNNQATIQNVRIRSSDPAFAGDIGLELGTGENGPLLVENVIVDGFNVGIRTAIQTASQTFEKISLSNQQQYGWVNEADQNVFVRELTSNNRVQAIRNFPVSIGENAVFTLVDSELIGTGNASTLSAILTEERFYAKNVSTVGYSRPITYAQSNGFIAGNMNLEGNYIEEYWSEGGQDRFTGGTFELFDGSPDGSLQLDVRDAPRIPLETDFSKWASPSQFVRANFDGTPSGVAGDAFDDSTAIQAAIDSGATTVYFPSLGEWIIDSTVELRASVARLIGMEASIGSPTGDGVIRVGNGTASSVVIERIALGAGRTVEIQHDSQRTLVARNLIGFDYRSVTQNPGDLFLYDVVNSYFEFRNQNVWARQLNIEGAANTNDSTLPAQKILNDNSKLWVLGLKLEKEGTVVRTINGGQTELLGVYRNNANASDASNPAFVTVDSALSVVNHDQATAASQAWALWASETRNGVTRTSDRFAGAHVYSAFNDATLWDIHREVVVDNLDPEVSYVGNWTSAATLPGGYIDQDFVYSADVGASATFRPSLPVAGSYEVYVRWVEAYGTTVHSPRAGAVPLSIQHSAGTFSTNIDQRTNGGKWVSFGSYNFASGTTGAVTMRTVGNTNNTAVDGVRFVLRSTNQPIPSSPAFPITAIKDEYKSDIFSGGEYSFGLNGILSNDVDRNNLPLTVTAFTQGSGGIVNITPTGTLSYRPDPWFTGLDTFTYTVSNGSQSTIGTVQVTVQDPLIQTVPTPVFRRPLSVAEQKERNSSAISIVSVEEFRGDSASRLVGAGRRIDTGVGGYVGHDRSPDTTMFAGPTNASVTLDLNGLHRLETIRLWNYNAQQETFPFARRTNRGAAQVNLYVDSDLDRNGAADNFVFVRTISLREASARADYTGEVFDLGGLDARFVKLDALSSLGSTTNSGLSEIEIRGARTANADAPEIPNVQIAGVSSQPNPNRIATRTLGPGFVAIDNSHGNARGSNWESALTDPTPFITYDLQAAYRVGSIRVWNYNSPDSLDRGARTMDIYVSNDNQSFTLHKSIQLLRGTGLGNYNGEVFDLSRVAARYVRLNITASHGATGNVGLAEVRFFGDQVVVPRVSTVSVNGGSAYLNPSQRSQLTSLVVSFDTPVVLSQNAFSIFNANTNVAIAASQILLSPASSFTTSFTITFGIGLGVVTRSAGRGNSLADGNYRLSVDATKVSSNTALMQQNFQFGQVATDQFFRLYGDSDGDGDVDGTDLIAFRRASMLAPSVSNSYNAAFDADGDGITFNDFEDRSAFTLNYNKRRRSL